MSRRKVSQSPPNPYALAFVTAVLAAVLSVLGNYLSSNFQTKQTLIQRQFEYRAQAYNTFLDNLESSKSPTLRGLLEISTLSETGLTDGQLQESEDEAAIFLKNNNLRNIYSQFYSSIGVLRLHGTPIVQKYCDDILLMLAYRGSAIDWSTYPATFQDSYESANIKSTPEDDYLDPKISEQDRAIIVMTAKIFNLLVHELRSELHSEVEQNQS